jgi:hypothetical protein
MMTPADETFEKILSEIVTKGDLRRLEFYIATGINSSEKVNNNEYSKPGTP